MRGLLYYILFNVLIAQLGINVYSISCYCLKEISVSLILPSEDHCNKIKSDTCCKSKGECKISSGDKHKDCSKKNVEYKSSDSLSEKPAVKDFFIEKNYLHVQIISFSLKSIQVLKNTFREPEYQISQQKLYLRHCAWLC